MTNQNLKDYKISYNSETVAKFFQELGQIKNIKQGEKIFAYSKFKFTWQNKNEIYFLLDGKINIQTLNQDQFNIESGEIFGAFTRYTSDNSTATAQLASTLIILDEKQFLRVTKKYPEFILMIMDFLLIHIKNTQSNNIKDQHPEKNNRINKDNHKIAEKLLQQLIDIIGNREVIAIPAKQMIFQEGSNASLMYLILEGRTTIHVNNKLIWTGERGDIIGEIALIDKCRRTASLMAETNCSLLSINRQTFLNLIQTLPMFGIALLKVLASRSSLPRTKDDYVYNHEEVINNIIVEETNNINESDPKNAKTWKII